ncbi:MAG: hemerythrin domain-containing protein [Polyangiaceae bacterium]|nr:hemerythrin domain-containing protein [Polyangiaceae bacterium]
MLHTIKRKASPTRELGPVELLLECHQRIRTFTALAARLAGAADRPHHEVSTAAAQVHRYFTVALPLHEADEEESITPLLLSEPGGEAVAAATTTMADEHRAAHELLGALEPGWARLAEDPRELARLAPALASTTDALAALFVRHLAREETEIFPRIAALTEEQRRALVTAMRTRRGA